METLLRNIRDALTGYGDIDAAAGGIPRAVCIDGEYTAPIGAEGAAAAGVCMPRPCADDAHEFGSPGASCAASPPTQAIDRDTPVHAAADDAGTMETATDGGVTEATTEVTCTAPVDHADAPPSPAAPHGSTPLTSREAAFIRIRGHIDDIKVAGLHERDAANSMLATLDGCADATTSRALAYMDGALGSVVARQHDATGVLRRHQAALHVIKRLGIEEDAARRRAAGLRVDGEMAAEKAALHDAFAVGGRVVKGMSESIDEFQGLLGSCRRDDAGVEEAYPAVLRAQEAETERRRGETQHVAAWSAARDREFLDTIDLLKEKLHAAECEAPQIEAQRAASEAACRALLDDLVAELARLAHLKQTAHTSHLRAAAYTRAIDEQCARRKALEKASRAMLARADDLVQASVTAEGVLGTCRAAALASRRTLLERERIADVLHTMEDALEEAVGNLYCSMSLFATRVARSGEGGEAARLRATLAEMEHAVDPRFLELAGVLQSARDNDLEENRKYAAMTPDDMLRHERHWISNMKRLLAGVDEKVEAARKGKQAERLRRQRAEGQERYRHGRAPADSAHAASPHLSSTASAADPDAARRSSARMSLSMVQKGEAKALSGQDAHVMDPWLGGWRPSELESYCLLRGEILEHRQDRALTEPATKEQAVSLYLKNADAPFAKSREASVRSELSERYGGKIVTHLPDDVCAKQQTLDEYIAARRGELEGQEAARGAAGLAEYAADHLRAAAADASASQAGFPGRSNLKSQRSMKGGTTMTTKVETAEERAPAGERECPCDTPGTPTGAVHGGVGPRPGAADDDLDTLGDGDVDTTAATSPAATHASMDSSTASAVADALCDALDIDSVLLLEALEGIHEGAGGRSRSASPPRGAAEASPDPLAVAGALVPRFEPPSGPDSSVTRGTGDLAPPVVVDRAVDGAGVFTPLRSVSRLASPSGSGVGVGGAGDNPDPPTAGDIEAFGREAHQATLTALMRGFGATEYPSQEHPDFPARAHVEAYRKVPYHSVPEYLATRRHRHPGTNMTLPILVDASSHATGASLQLPPGASPADTYVSADALVGAGAGWPDALGLEGGTREGRDREEEAAGATCVAATTGGGRTPASTAGGGGGRGADAAFAAALRDAEARHGAAGDNTTRAPPAFSARDLAENRVRGRRLGSVVAAIEKIERAMADAAGSGSATGGTDDDPPGSPSTRHAPSPRTGPAWAKGAAVGALSLASTSVGGGDQGALGSVPEEVLDPDPPTKDVLLSGMTPQTNEERLQTLQEADFEPLSRDDCILPIRPEVNRKEWRHARSEMEMRTRRKDTTLTFKERIAAMDLIDMSNVSWVQLMRGRYDDRPRLTSIKGMPGENGEWSDRDSNCSSKSGRSVRSGRSAQSRAGTTRTRSIMRFKKAAERIKAQPRLWNGERLVAPHATEGTTVTGRNYRVVQPHPTIRDCSTRRAIGLVIAEVNKAVASQQRHVTMDVPIALWNTEIVTALATTYSVTANVMEWRADCVVLELILVDAPVRGVEDSAT